MWLAPTISTIDSRRSAHDFVNLLLALIHRLQRSFIFMCQATAVLYRVMPSVSDHVSRVFLVSPRNFALSCCCAKFRYAYVAHGVWSAAKMLGELLFGAETMLSSPWMSTLFVGRNPFLVSCGKSPLLVLNTAATPSVSEHASPFGVFPIRHSSAYWWFTTFRYA